VAAFRAFENNLVGFAHTALWVQSPLWSRRFYSCCDPLVHILCGCRSIRARRYIELQPRPERLPSDSTSAASSGLSHESLKSGMVA
jgi:hypothetical protein